MLLKQKQRSKETFRRIMNDFPGTPEAAQSKDRLQELK
jgi:TolA-binding protein